MGGVCTIRFGLYNIHNGRNSELESALRGMLQAKVDLGIFQEMKFISRVGEGGKGKRSAALVRDRGGGSLQDRRAGTGWEWDGSDGV